MNDLPFLTTVSDYMRQLAHIEDFYKHKIIKHSIKVSDEITLSAIELTSATPKHTLVIVPGRAECEHKYAELLYSLRQQNLQVFVIFVRGQGMSSKVIKGSLKCHIDDFNVYRKDLAFALDALNIKTPYLLMAFSMGGLISLDFLLHEKNKPQRVALLAPYLWPAFNLPEPILKLFVNTVGNLPLLKYLYTPHGAEYKRIEFKKNIHSHCFDRYETYHDYYGLHPDLALGGPSFAFVKEALKKQLEIMNSNVDFTIPMLTVTAGDDHVVSTPHTINFMRKHLNDISRPKYFNLSGAYHDLLNESDEYRNLALTYAFNFLLHGEIK